MSNDGTSTVNQWCSSCMEVRRDHASICLTCGSTLTQQPQASSTSSDVVTTENHGVATNEGNSTTIGTNARSLYVFDLLNSVTRTGHAVRLLHTDLQRNRRELQLALESMRQRIDGVRNEQEALLAAILASREDAASLWEGIPTALLDPSNNNSVFNKATDETYLKNIPRIQIQADSNLFHQASLSVSITANDIGNSESYISVLDHVEVIPAEFGNEHMERIYNKATHHQSDILIEDRNTSDCIRCTSSISLDGVYLIAADPITCKGIQVTSSDSSMTSPSVDVIRSIQGKDSNAKFVWFCTRGDNITFVKKAILGQNLGAVACVIGNNISEPWPYTMKDSNGEASLYSLNIPVVMTSLQQTNIILQSLRKLPTTNLQHNTLKCSLKIQRQPSEDGCIICTEAFTVNQTVLQLQCKHVFHESCALQWLTKHNTCPYCRYELPTKEQNQLHVPQQRTSQTDSVHNIDSFYG